MHPVPRRDVLQRTRDDGIRGVSPGHVPGDFSQIQVPSTLAPPKPACAIATMSRFLPHPGLSRYWQTLMVQEESGSIQCMACSDAGMSTAPGASDRMDCQCPSGTFVKGWDSTSAECRICDSPLQLCDETHQIVPKPSGPGIWISPADGAAFTCEPYTACIQHTSVEDVLLGTCREGYQVHSRLTENCHMTLVPLSVR